MRRAANLGLLFERTMISDPKFTNEAHLPQLWDACR